MLVHDLSHDECRQVLRHANIGRLGCALYEQPYIVPIHMYFDDDAIYSFAALGQKIEWMRQNPKVCVEVDDVTDSDLVGYWRAADILNDPALSPSRKKALLAYWASDVHAVAGAPSLRSARGVTVTVDSLFEAMATLDREIDQAAMPPRPAGSSRTW